MRNYGVKYFKRISRIINVDFWVGRVLGCPPEVIVIDFP